MAPCILRVLRALLSANRLRLPAECADNVSLTWDVALRSFDLEAAKFGLLEEATRLFLISTAHRLRLERETPSLFKIDMHSSETCHSAMVLGPKSKLVWHPGAFGNIAKTYPRDGDIRSRP